MKSYWLVSFWFTFLPLILSLYVVTSRCGLEAGCSLDAGDGFEASIANNKMTSRCDGESESQLAHLPPIATNQRFANFDDFKRIYRVQESDSARIPPARQSYLGREIAQTMHYAGARWLIRENREDEERCSMLLANMGLKPGMTVCDMGVGNGFYALQIAELIGESGQVIGVDVQPEMLVKLRERMSDKSVQNVTPVLGSFHDPRLEANTIDLVLMVDVYHEFSHPELMLAAIRRALKPNGVICLVEYRMEDPKVPIKRLHKMSKAQILKEYEPNGFKLIREFDRLPWQHVMFFGKDDQ